MGDTNITISTTTSGGIEAYMKPTTAMTDEQFRNICIADMTMREMRDMLVDAFKPSPKRGTLTLK